jgi:hypothetical protein
VGESKNSNKKNQLIKLREIKNMLKKEGIEKWKNKRINSKQKLSI